MMLRPLQTQRPDHLVTRRSREYLTAEEVDLLSRTARRQGRYGQRNATLILRKRHSGRSGIFLRG
jgi:hypothetical protein